MQRHSSIKPDITTIGMTPHKPIQDDTKELVVFMTGFGKFGKILENPTTKLSKALPELLKEKPIENVSLAKNYVVTVAMEDCDSVI